MSPASDSLALAIRKILFPTDFSELSLVALRYARAFSEQFAAHLYCLHVVDEAQQYWSALGPEATPIAPPVDDILEAAGKQMQAFHDEHLIGLEYAPVTKVALGKPFVEIITYAREITADLLVMATHGRSGLMHALMGSTAERVVRKAPCPVLTVRAGEHEFVLP
ncbi:MAG TPA: universal stress protein [Phycisphaerae bacterium]|nr:universal stress protein [Phycisphaerae bacterium]